MSFEQELGSKTGKTTCSIISLFVKLTHSFFPQKKNIYMYVYRYIGYFSEIIYICKNAEISAENWEALIDL